MNVFQYYVWKTTSLKWPAIFLHKNTFSNTLVFQWPPSFVSRECLESILINDVRTLIKIPYNFAPLLKLGRSNNVKHGVEHLSRSRKQLDGPFRFRFRFLSAGQRVSRVVESWSPVYYLMLRNRSMAGLAPSAISWPRVWLRVDHVVGFKY